MSRATPSKRLVAARVALMDAAGGCCDCGAALDTAQLTAFGPGVPDALDRLTIEVRAGGEPAIEDAARALAAAVTARVKDLPDGGFDDPGLAFMRAVLTLRERLSVVDNAGADLRAAEKKTGGDDAGPDR